MNRCTIRLTTNADARRTTVEPLGEDPPGENDALARKLAGLAHRLDPVPPSVVDDARAAFSRSGRADGRSGHSNPVRDPEPAEFDAPPIS